MADPITFTDDENSCRVLIVGSDIPRSQLDALRYATPDDLARAGYEPTTQALDRLAIEASIVAEDTRRELEALRAFEQYFRATKHYVRHGGPFPVGNMNELLKAVDEARK